ncbi:MAG: PHP domain-containing protein [Methanocellales archaeon]|nr:PHP domain-containing protein [Methanocellales archaeon]
MLRFDLHVHSNFSRDGYDPIDSILKRAEEIGLNGIAITDHNTIEGGLTGIKRARALGLDLMVIPGVEVSTAEGHLVALGITKDIPPDLPVDETIKIAKDLGGIIIVPHPFHPFRHGLGYIPKDVDAIEVYNSRCITGYSNGRARDAAARMGISMVAGSDAHTAATIGYAITELNAKPLMNEVLDAIKTGDTKIRGKKIPLHIFAKQALRGVPRRVHRFISKHC